MIIPEKVKIGWREYSIEQDKGRRDEEGNFLSGQIDYSNAEIYINSDYSEDEMKASLLHEIMHGIFYKQGQDEWKNNECLVNAIAEGLYELIKDNPELFK